ncbi:MAG: ABC transporter family substrate-binding protein [Corynebacterium casei]|uniref:Dipeptide/oligopeptide ABC transporter,substrate-binding protein n=2 Tax=Corynebacterium casei TaxID=160386 RepID=G7HUR7_9CORY|nr:ABC transporter family substrate-binding protein [Corynebacterium casei]CCE53885.1 dipeptide/oligopeptide ABC transporter,substrate-binding protein [Corynebacterium casei UCMA 3821]
MKISFRKSAIAAVTASALILSGCAGGDSGSSGSDSSADGASAPGEELEVSLDGAYNEQDRESLAKGGELTLAILEISEQQNPFQADATLYTNNVWKFYNPQMTLFNGKGEFEPNNDYLTDVTDEVVDGKTVVTYTIHEDAQYNDGTPIDWKSFEHTWKFNNGENEELNVSSTDGYELIESVTQGENEKQAVVTFKQEYAWWQGLFGFLLPTQVDSAEVYNEGYINELHPEWGAGPYKVDNVDFNTGTVSFVPNENWWGDEPKLDRVTFRQMESQASINAFKAGEVDATGVASKDRLASVEDMDGIEIRTAIRPSNILITLNSESPHLGDIKVREAIMTGIDRAQLATIRFNGIGYEEELPGSFTLYQTQEGYEDIFGELVQFDVEKAKSLLDEAGWTEGSNGVREKDGETLTLNYVLLGDDPNSRASASATQKMMRDIGVDLQIQERPSSDFSKVITERSFDVFPMGFTSSDPFGVAYFGQTYMSDSELNQSGTGTEELDAKIEELQQIGDGDEQIARANELEKEALGTYGIMPFANGPDMVAVADPKLANYGAYSLATVGVEDIGYME